MTRSATFTVVLRTHGEGAHRRLARTLKTALRRDRLKAIDVREHPAPEEKKPPPEGEAAS